jgi:uncharacterized protein YbjT (DUF2867 family)
MEEGRQVLVLGATGFIGRRLIPALLEVGVRVRSLSRNAPAAATSGVETFTGDLLTGAGLKEALQHVDTAYYLVHSLAGGRRGFAVRDRQAALNFVAAADAAGVRRVIYLGGLGETGAELSRHLASRAEVARILAQGRYALTVLRAAVIVGSGGASYEIIRALVKRLPVMIIPRWVDTRCQPIAVGDVIRYLVGCLDERTAGATFDIGGPEILTYRQMMEIFAAAAGEVNLYIPVPLLTPRLSSYWVGLVTPVKASIAMPLIEGLGNEVVCQEERIRELIPFETTPFQEAVQLALAEGEKRVG